MDSLSLDPETKAEDLTCHKHGQVTVTRIKVFTDWLPARCPVCENEREAERIAEEEVRKKTRAEEQDRQLLRHLYGQAAIPPRFEGRSFDKYIVPKGGDHAINAKLERAREVCAKYASEFPAMLANGTSMILCGNTGTGKTHLACAIANNIIAAHRKSAVYMTVGRAFRAVKDTYNRDSEITEQKALERFRMPDLLILDEIGIQHGSDAERNILFEIVNERYESLKPTIIISNLALNALAEYAGDRVIDRLKENGGRVMIFDWKSRRSA